MFRFTVIPEISGAAPQRFFKYPGKIIPIGKTAGQSDILNSAVGLCQEIGPVLKSDPGEVIQRAYVETAYKLPAQVAG